MAFRSRRLEALLGGRVDQLTYEQVAELVNVEEAAEAEDLDYKRELTASDPKGKEELAKDVSGCVRLVSIRAVRRERSDWDFLILMDLDVTSYKERHQLIPHPPGSGAFECGEGVLD
ncbi:hypothetical protein ACFY2N_27470 [Streptomyces rubiginosohelvolus]|uniref:hypothetical protein n=1 Tax=Streptomyces rubiginosohelvolus TaxID=67362 RepID=UPI0036CF4C97